AWVSGGQELIRELVDIEGELFPALLGLVGGVRQALGPAGDLEEMARLDGETEHRALALFEEIGALDTALSPWPAPGNEWAALMIQQMLAAASGQGRVYDPRAGLRQFKRGQTSGAY
ncbi:unnamed protein product, partial [marine sediment metagenome]